MDDHLLDAPLPPCGSRLTRPTAESLYYRLRMATQGLRDHCLHGSDAGRLPGPAIITTGQALRGTPPAAGGRQAARSARTR